MFSKPAAKFHVGCKVKFDCKNCLVILFKLGTKSNIKKYYIKDTIGYLSIQVAWMAWSKLCKDVLYNKILSRNTAVICNYKFCI